MYPFSPSLHPAVRTHLDAQTAFFNDLSKSVFFSFEQVCKLNVQLAQTMFEETTLTGQQLLSADRQSELLGVAASRAQPATEKLRAYQQHIARLTADAQVELARVAEQHVPNTTRTARQLADEVARTATEETARGLRRQQDAAQSFVDPFFSANGHARTPNNGAGASMQSGTGGQSQGGQAARGDASQAGAQSGAGAGKGAQHVS